MLDATALTEVEVEDGDRKIRVVRKPAPVAAASLTWAASFPGSHSSSESRKAM